MSSVLLCRPGPKFNAVGKNPTDYSFVSPPNVVLAQKQHDSLSEKYRKNGIEVLYINESPSFSPNQVFLRDNFSVTPEGVIIGKLKSGQRSKERKLFERLFKNNGIPVLNQLDDDDSFECGDLIIVDKKLALLTQSKYSNKSGVVKILKVLKNIGISRVVTGYLDDSYGHLDEVIAILDINKAFGIRNRVPNEILNSLTARGIEIIDAPSLDELQNGMALNLVTLSPGHVLIPGRNPITLESLNSKGVVCEEVDLSEFIKGGGAVRCLTGVIKKTSK